MKLSLLNTQNERAALRSSTQQLRQSAHGEPLMLRAVRRSSARGVTLVEVLIVVAIMAMLAGGVAFAYLPRMQETRVKTARQGALEIRKMVQLWQTENGTDCPSLSQLKKDGYLDRAGASDDPWGEPFEINCSDNEIYVSSPGADKKGGTPDDIQVPKSGSDDEDS